MKTKRLIWWFALAVGGAVSLQAQTTVLTYQGRLTDTANPAGGLYDLRFSLHDNPTNVVSIAGPVTNAVSVSEGLFTVQLDFGGSVFFGPDRWLEIAVRTNGASAFTPLSPRQFITSTPYAIYAANATTAAIASSVAASNITGGISHAQLPSDVLLNGQSGVILSGAFSGNGNGLTDLNASNLSSGFVADTLLSPNIAFLTGTNVFTGTNRFTSALLAPNAENQISGKFSGDGSALVNLNAGNLAAGSVSDTRLSDNVAFLNGTNNFVGTNEFSNVVIATNVENQISGLFAGNGSGLTDLKAVNLIGTVSDSRLSPNVAFVNTANSFSGQNNFGGVIVAVNAGNEFGGNGSGLTGVNAATLGGAGANSFWRTDGNAGTLPGSNFIGTTDNEPFEIRVNGYSALRFQPNGTVPGVIPPTLVGGYYLNTAGNSSGAVIAGGGARSGAENVALGDFAFVGGGNANRAADYSVVVGGNINAASGQSSIVVGGNSNTNQGNYSFVGGGIRNLIEVSDRCVIGGGSGNLIRTGSVYSVIGGGRSNRTGTNSQSAVVSGGEANSAIETYDTVGGGYDNRASGSSSTVGGGYQNGSSGRGATVSGGSANRSLGDYAAIAGGQNNFTTGLGSVIPGGFDNAARGDYSFAGGRLAAANHTGAFVWGGSEGLSSTAPNQFAVRATGGIFFDGLVGIGKSSPGAQVDVEGGQSVGRFTSTNDIYGSVLSLRSFATSPFYVGAINFENSSGTPGQIGYLANDTLSFRVGGVERVKIDGNGNLNFGGQTRQMINLYDTQYAIGVQDFNEYFRSDSTFSWFRGGVHNNATRNPGGGVELMHLTFTGNLNIAGVFGSLSDRNAKEQFQAVNGRDVLEKVVALPISTWNYKTDKESRHLGPMAQDFYAAFGLGTDDKRITTVDADGVALAAIQGLNEKLETNKREAERRIQTLETENSELQARLEKLETMVSKLTIQ